MKPSDIILAPGAPLTGTMERAEVEHAALLLVRTLQRNGDEWRGVTPKEVGEAIKADLAEGLEPLKSLNANPFFRPDIPDLVRRGFAEGDLTAIGSEIAFTEKGKKALERWRRT